MIKKISVLLTVLSFVLVCLNINPSVLAADEDRNNTEVDVISLKHLNSLEVDKVIYFNVEIANFDPENPKEMTQDGKHAFVHAFFTKGDENLQATLLKKGNGEYQGQIVLPSAGEWKVTVMAAKPGLTPGSLDTTWNVTDPRQANDDLWIWLTVGVVIAAIILISLFLWVRKKKAA